MLFTFPQVLFGLFNVMSGTSAFESYYLTAYNLAFTAWPLIITATFDWDINYKRF
jgi:hypothetical protein